MRMTLQLLSSSRLKRRSHEVRRTTRVPEIFGSRWISRASMRPSISGIW
jgi:hypothetical protein